MNKKSPKKLNMDNKPFDNETIEKVKNLKNNNPQNLKNHFKTILWNRRNERDCWYSPNRVNNIHLKKYQDC